MTGCRTNGPPPSIEMLRAYAADELHGDGAGELASHIEECEECTGRLRALLVVDRCNRALESLAATEPAALMPVAAAWQGIAEGVFELRKALAVTVERGLGFTVAWMDGIGVTSTTPALQMLDSEEVRRLEKRIPVARGDADMSCELSVFQDKYNQIRIAVTFDNGPGRLFGLLQASLTSSGNIVEVMSIAEQKRSAFRTGLSTGEYRVVLRGADREYHVSIDIP